MKVTRIQFKWGGRPEAIVYWATLWDIDDSFFDGIRKGRYILDESGDVLCFDNMV